MKMTRIFGVISNDNDKDIWCDIMTMTRIFGDSSGAGAVSQGRE